VKGAVLLVGDELLGGVITDRHVAAIVETLSPHGVGIAAVEIVPDDEEAIARAAVRRAAECELLVVCGGIGPTDDDVTRQALARALGVPLREDTAVRRGIEARLAERGVGPESAARQSLFPEGTVPVANPVGTAPGFRGRLGACAFWVLPGVPVETREMLRQVADSLPAVREDQDRERIVATVGLGETRAAELLRAGAFRPPAGISLAYLPRPGGVRLRLFAPEGFSRAAFDEAERAMRTILGDEALPRATLVESLLVELETRGRTFATAESCTGGLLGARFTDVPGASSVYLGGVVTYSNRAKVERLGVSAEAIEAHGAVSEEVAVALAEGCRKVFGASLAVSVTGVAGPSGGTPDKPVGTVWIGIADGGGSGAERFRFPGPRDLVRERTVNKALEMAYRRTRRAAG